MSTREHALCPDCGGCLTCGIHTTGVTCNGTSSTHATPAEPSGLIAFLTARLDEDEYHAKAAQLRAPGPWTHEAADTGPAGAEDMHDASGDGMAIVRGSYLADFLILHDPARVLREVEAGREIMALHANGGGGLRDPREGRITHDYHVDVCEVCGPCPWPSEDKSPYRYVTTWGDDEGRPTFWPCRTLRILAAVYDDHPDYRQEWKP